MATVLHLPLRDDRPAPERRRLPADVVDISQRFFDMPGLKETARDLNALPNPRDIEAGIEAVLKDYRRILRERHGLKGKLAGEHVRVVRIALRGEINRLRTRKESHNGRVWRD